jgi:hypothetical protein
MDWFPSINNGVYISAPQTGIDRITNGRRGSQCSSLEPTCTIQLAIANECLNNQMYGQDLRTRIPTQFGKTKRKYLPNQIYWRRHQISRSSLRSSEMKCWAKDGFFISVDNYSKSFPPEFS